MVSNDLNM